VGGGNNNYFNNHVIQRENAHDDFYSKPGYITSITPRAALLTSQKKNKQ
jgi:hypothetical protein